MRRSSSIRSRGRCADNLVELELATQVELEVGGMSKRKRLDPIMHPRTDFSRSTMSAPGSSTFAPAGTTPTMTVVPPLRVTRPACRTVVGHRWPRRRSRRATVLVAASRSSGPPRRGTCCSGRPLRDLPEQIASEHGSDDRGSVTERVDHLVEVLDVQAVVAGGAEGGRTDRER